MLKAVLLISSYPPNKKEGRHVRHPIYNFPPGPAVLPEAVLRTAQRNARLQRYGFPVMAMSHRSDMFLSILHHAEQDLRQLLNIPSNYKIPVLQGGAITQFQYGSHEFSAGFATAERW